MAGYCLVEALLTTMRIRHPQPMTVSYLHAIDIELLYSLCKYISRVATSTNGGCFVTVPCVLLCIHIATKMQDVGALQVFCGADKGVCWPDGL